jgi:hypothetical protein
VSGIIALRGLVRPGLRLTMPFLLLMILLFSRVALMPVRIYSTYLHRMTRPDSACSKRLPPIRQLDAALSRAAVESR